MDNSINLDALQCPRDSNLSSLDDHRAIKPLSNWNPKPLDGFNWLRIPADQGMRFFFLHTINLLVPLLGSADHYYSALVLCD